MAAMAVEKELGKESSLQDMLNEISRAGQLDLDLDARDFRCDVSQALLKAVWTAVVTRQMGDLTEELSDIFEIPDEKLPRLKKGVRLLALALRATVSEAQKQQAATMPTRKKQKMPRADAARVAGPRPGAGTGASSATALAAAAAHAGGGRAPAMLSLKAFSATGLSCAAHMIKVYLDEGAGGLKLVAEFKDTSLTSAPHFLDKQTNFVLGGKGKISPLKICVEIFSLSQDQQDQVKETLAGCARVKVDIDSNSYTATIPIKGGLGQGSLTISLCASPLTTTSDTGAAAAAPAAAAAAVAAAAAAPVPFGSVRQKLVRKTTSAAKLCFGVTISGESYCAENLPALIAAFAAMDPPIKVEGISSKEFNELAHGIDSRRSRSGGAREVAAMVTPEAAAAAVPAAHPGHPGDFSDI